MVTEESSSLWSSLSSSTPTVPWTALVVAILSLIYSCFHSRRKDVNDDSSNIPWAPRAIPILGHAILYRQDPSGFLIRTCAQVGPIFQVNLAGKHMILVCGPHLQRAIATAPESQFSARIAIADLGFAQTLGYRNVHQGTDIHKGIVKGIWCSSPSQQVKGWMESIQAALASEVRVKVKEETTHEVEWLQLIRRVILRASIDRMIGTSFLDNWDFPFVTEFMSYQDTLEDVTAKAAVLPKWLALPAMLWPLQRRRERLQQTIANRLQTILENYDKDSKKPDDFGFWLEALLVKDNNQQYPVEEIAEYIVGLLFAAHKNPAIGAAQAYLMLWERGSANDQRNCTNEAKTLLENPDWSTIQKSCQTLSRLCLETLRLTAHSIGGVRTAQQDIVIQNYKIPKGASVALSHICPNLQEQQWSSPQTFDMNHRPLEDYQDEYRFTTFSHGVHKCPGQQQALVILQCTVAILLTRYEINLPTTLPSLSFERATLAQREGPVMVTIRPKE